MKKDVTANNFDEEKKYYARDYYAAHFDESHMSDHCFTQRFIAIIMAMKKRTHLL